MFNTYESKEKDKGCRIEDRVVPFEDAVRAAGEWLGTCKGNVVFLTGAGISAESGIPTFRDPELGLWKNKIMAAMMDTTKGWRLTPQSAWEAYLKFRKVATSVEPNAAHFAVAQCSSKLPNHPHVTVITQNVDMLHQMAGMPAEDVWDIHGTIYSHKCTENGHKDPDLGSWHSTRDLHEELPEKQPVCKQCGGHMRPDFVLMDEEIEPEMWKKCETLCTTLKPGDVMIVIGTSCVMYPTAFLPYHARRCKGVRVIEINIEPSEFTSYADCFVCGKASTAMESIINAAVSFCSKTE